MSRLMNFFVSVVGIVAVLSSAGVLQATTINIDFNQNGGASGTYSGLGAYTGDAGTYWNGYTVGSGTSGTLTASDGTTATSVNFTLSSTQADDQSANPAALAPALMDDYTYQSGTFTITGLQAGAKYELYLYSQNGSYGNTTSTFAVGAATGTATGTGDGSLGGGNPTNFLLNRNYVVLSDLTADLNGSISGSSSFVFNGLQIVSTIPEPSAIIILCTGLLGLLAYAWRRQK